MTIQAAGQLIGLILFFLSLILLFASWFYPKAEDGQYLVEKWIHLETQTLKKIFRRAGWSCLGVGFYLLSWFGVVID